MVILCLSVTVVVDIPNFFVGNNVLLDSLHVHGCFCRLSRGSTHQSLHETLYDSESSSEASEEEEQQDRRPVSERQHYDSISLIVLCVLRSPMLTYPVNIGRFRSWSST